MKAALSFLKRLMTSSSIFLFSESIRVLKPNLSYLKLTRRLSRLDFLQHFKSGAMSFGKHHLSCIYCILYLYIFYDNDKLNFKGFFTKFAQRNHISCKNYINYMLKSCILHIWSADQLFLVDFKSIMSPYAKVSLKKYKS